MSAILQTQPHTFLPKGTLGFAVYTALLFLAAMSLPDVVFNPASKQFILIIGFFSRMAILLGPGYIMCAPLSTQNPYSPNGEKK